MVTTRSSRSGSVTRAQASPQASLSSSAKKATPSKVKKTTGTLPPTTELPASCVLAYLIICCAGFLGGFVLIIYPEMPGSDSVHGTNPLARFATRELGIFILAFGLCALQNLMIGSFRSQQQFLRLVWVVTLMLTFNHLFAMTFEQPEQVLPHRHDIIESIVLTVLGTYCLMDPVQLFQQYLQIKTVHPTPDYASAIDFLKKEMDSIGLEHFVLEVVAGKPGLFAIWRGTDQKLASFLLNSHTDVVPVVQELWNWDPFEAKIDEASGNIYARGTQDMKSVTIQNIEAIRRLKASGYQPKRNIVLAFVPDEEIGSVQGMELYIKTEEFKALNIGVALDEGLASPTDTYSVFYGERLPWWVNLKVNGPTGHGSRFIEGTAVEKLTRIVDKILAFRHEQKCKHQHEHKPLGEVITVNVTKLKAGVTHDGGKTFQLNVIPTVAEAGLDIRLPPSVDPPEFLKQLDAWIADEGATREFVWAAMTNPVTPIGAEAVWWHAVEGAFKKLNIPIKTEIFPASTDGRFLRTLNIPVFGFSPMIRTPILLHDHNEFVNKDVFLEGINIYEKLIPLIAEADLP